MFSISSSALGLKTGSTNGCWTGLSPFPSCWLQPGTPLWRSSCYILPGSAARFSGLWDVLSRSTWFAGSRNSTNTKVRTSISLFLWESCSVCPLFWPYERRFCTNGVEEDYFRKQPLIPGQLLTDVPIIFGGFHQRIQQHPNVPHGLSVLQGNGT